MEFYSALNKAMRLLETKKAMNFFFKNTKQKKRIKKLIQIIWGSQDSNLEFNTDLLISVRSAADSFIKTLAK